MGSLFIKSKNNDTETKINRKDLKELNKIGEDDELSDVCSI